MAEESFDKYGAVWPIRATPLHVEMACIRLNGRWKDTKRGNNECGMGLSFHYEQMRRILWPKLDGDHNGQRWHTLAREEILKNKVTVLMGPGSCGKTHEAAWIYLCEYMVFPEETCVLVSSTHMDGLRLRVWGEITQLWQQAIDRFPWLPGHLLDSKILISTDELSEDQFDERKARDWRKGIKGIPCMQNNKFVGLSKYQGIKQKRMRLIADEASAMGISFLSAFSNLNKNEDFRAIILGNPLDILDPLGKAAEPCDGWSTHMEPEKTEVWKTRFMDGTCVNFIGTDSPNFDHPADKPDKFPYLISRKKIAETLSFFDKESPEYYSQCVGAMKIGLLARRVVTRDECRRFQAMDDVVWKGSQLTRIYGLDSAYGGDRCVGGYVEFGENDEGKTILNIHPPHIIPMRVALGVSPEDHIAEKVKENCVNIGIPPENMFHDSTGRGSLGTSLARAWSAMTNPVEFGGAPTERPVCLDMFIWDAEKREKRLKRCDEHYSKFVTELWFSIRYAIEAGQVRNLPEEVMDELCMRQWDWKGTKYEIEPKTGTPERPGMKQRVGRSPDLADWLAICVEGARRRGFQISKLANPDSEVETVDFLRDLREKANSFRAKGSLAYQR